MNEILGALLENPETIKTLVGSYVEKYKPVAYYLLDEAHTTMNDYANNVEYFETVAKAKRNQYDAFINAGFTAEQSTAFMLQAQAQMTEHISKATSSVGKQKANKA